MRRLNKIPLPVFFHFLLWTVFFAALWGRTILHDADGGISAGNFVGVWGDWCAHFAMGSAMALKGLFLPKSPFLIGAPFYYPFAADLISAILLRAGTPFFASFTVPSLVFSLFMLYALFAFHREISGSERTAVVSSCIFLLNGGLGFLFYLDGVLHSPNALAAVFSPPAGYRDHYIYFEPLAEMIFSQRSFPLGFGLGALALAWIRSALHPIRESGRGAVKLAAAGLAIGVLPVTHPHTLLAVCLILAFWLAADVWEQGPGGFLKTRLKAWLALALPAAALGLPLMRAFIVGRVPAARFIRWYPGWYARDLPVGWLSFWLRNWSATPLLAAAGLAFLLRRGPKGRTWLVFLPFFVLFALVNLFAFAPWIWDNQKLLVWAALGFSALAGWAIREIAQRRTGTVKGKAWAAALLLLMTASGILEVFRLLVCQSASNLLYTREELEISEWAKAATPLDSVWLTSDRHNHWLYNLTGRQPLMAYGGWLWGWGLDDSAVRKDVGEMFRHPEDETLFKKYGVTYVVVGPDERITWHADPALFDRRFEAVKRTSSYAVYSTRNLAATPPSGASLYHWRTDSWRRGSQFASYRSDRRPEAAAQLEIRSDEPNDARWVAQAHLSPGWHHLTAAVRTEGVGRTAAGAGLSVLEDGIASDDVRGTSGWSEVGFYLKVGQGGADIMLACRLGGYGSANTGKAFFRDVRDLKVEMPAQDGDRRFDLDAVRKGAGLH